MVLSDGKGSVQWCYIYVNISVGNPDIFESEILGLRLKYRTNQPRPEPTQINSPARQQAGHPPPIIYIEGRFQTCGSGFLSLSRVSVLPFCQAICTTLEPHSRSSTTSRRMRAIAHRGGCSMRSFFSARFLENGKKGAKFRSASVTLDF